MPHPFKRLVLACSAVLLAACNSGAQPDGTLLPKAQPLAKLEKHWVDSVYRRLSDEERIGQLMNVAAYSGGPAFNQAAIEQLLKARQIGGITFMQGGPLRQAALTNRYQSLAQVPLMIAMDAEWGLGMRLDSVLNFPRQMMIGATRDTALAYQLGMAVAYQCKRLGVHVNFAPVVDVNNNANNPVINSRSFGEDKTWVAKLAIAYMRGMQDYGVMACAKHFPGHGDTEVDSHKDLPVISKSRAQLDTLELYPFRELIRAGVQSVMIAHLSIPALDATAKLPTTLSQPTVTGLLRNELGFRGLTFTDALVMQGVVKNFPGSDGDLKAYLAGNDVLLFPQDVPTAIAKIKAAIQSGKASRSDLEQRVKKVLAAKFRAGLSRFEPVQTDNLLADLNRYTAALTEKIAQASLTLVRDDNHILQQMAGKKVTYINLIVNRSISTTSGTEDRALKMTAGGLQGAAEERLQAFVEAGGGTFEKREIVGTSGQLAQLAALGKDKSRIVIIGLHGSSFYPGKNYGLDNTNFKGFLQSMADEPNVLIAAMGNAYVARNFCKVRSLVIGYEDNGYTTDALVDLLTGKLTARGRLPVTPACR